MHLKNDNIWLICINPWPLLVYQNRKKKSGWFYLLLISYFRWTSLSKIILNHQRLSLFTFINLTILIFGYLRLQTGRVKKCPFIMRWATFWQTNIFLHTWYINYLMLIFHIVHSEIGSQKLIEKFLKSLIKILISVTSHDEYQEGWWLMRAATTENMKVDIK